MAIDYNNGSTVRHLTYNGNYVKELKYNGTVAWEEYVGTYTPGTLPTGVSSLSCNRTSKDPAVGAGTIASGAALYNKDVLTFTPTPISYYTVSMKNSSYTVSAADVSSTSRESSFNGVSLSGITASRNMRTVTFNTPTCTPDDVSSFMFTYVAVYTNSSGAVITQGDVSSVSAWNGATVNWQLSLDSSFAYGWSMSSKTGTVGVGTGNASVTPSVSLSIRESYRWMPIMNPACTNFSGFPITRTSTTTSSLGLAGFSAWTFGGAASYSSNLRVTGTATVTNASGYSRTISFSNKQLTSSSVTLGSYSMTGSSGSVTMSRNDLLTTSVSNTGTVQLTKVVLTLTTIDVYVKYDAYSMIEASQYGLPTVDTSDGTIYLESCFLSGVSSVTRPYVHMCGYMTNSTGDASTGNAFKSLGQLDSYGTATLDPFTALNDSEAQGEITGADFCLAFMSTSANTTPISNMYTSDDFYM